MANFETLLLEIFEYEWEILYGTLSHKCNLELLKYYVKIKEFKKTKIKNKIKRPKTEDLIYTKTQPLVGRCNANCCFFSIFSSNEYCVYVSWQTN